MHDNAVLGRVSQPAALCPWRSPDLAAAGGGPAGRMSPSPSSTRWSWWCVAEFVHVHLPVGREMSRLCVVSCTSAWAGLAGAATRPPAAVEELLARRLAAAIPRVLSFRPTAHPIPPLSLQKIQVNDELKMGKGKTGAQCAHAAVGAVQRAELRWPHLLDAWELNGQAKICLRCRDTTELVRARACV